MVTQVALSKIEIPKKWRKVKKAAVESLADSFGKVGQLQEIGLRPHPKKAGEFVLVWGKHRVEAAIAIGWTEIDARIIAAEEKAAGYCTLAENLFRNPLSAAERVIALKSWHERYKDDHPEVHGKQASAQIRKAKAKAREAGEPEPELPDTFVEHASERTEMPRKTVERYIAAGKNLTDEQLGVLAEEGVTLETVATINKLNPDQQNHAVALIASGLNEKEALATATLPPNATFMQVGNPDEYRKTEADLTDEEWLETYCGEVLARLKYQAAFKKDALLYRHTMEARKSFRNQMKKPLAQGKTQIVSPLHLLLAKTVNLDSPSNWLPVRTVRWFRPHCGWQMRLLLRQCLRSHEGTRSVDFKLIFFPSGFQQQDQVMSNCFSNKGKDQVQSPFGGRFMRLVTASEPVESPTFDAETIFNSVSDYLEGMIFAKLEGLQFEHDPCSFEWASGVASGVRLTDPNNRNLLRARIATSRALHILPDKDLRLAIACDLGLAQHAVLRGDWPKPVEGLGEEGEWSSDVEYVFSLIILILGQSHEIVRAHREGNVELVEFYSRLATRSAILATVSLFGQEGLDGILKYEGVQETLLTSSIKDFAKGNVFPNISLPSCRNVG